MDPENYQKQVISQEHPAIIIYNKYSETMDIGNAAAIIQSYYCWELINAK